MVSPKDARQVRDLFELQLDFAGRMAERTGLDLPQAVSRYTNLHRRFGLGDIDKVAPSADWGRYLAGLEQLPTAAARLDWTLKVYERSPPDPPSPGQTAFGCFSCEAPDEQGAVRIHFCNRDAEDGSGPLSRSKLTARLGDLAAMFAFVRQVHPSAKSVRGASWLYHLEAYRRLFPAPYGDSRSPPDAPMRLSGSSSWGQFVDHRGAIKPELRRRFLDGLGGLDPAAPWRCFPLPVLAVSAPIELFHRFYDL